MLSLFYSFTKSKINQFQNASIVGYPLQRKIQSSNALDTIFKRSSRVAHHVMKILQGENQLLEESSDEALAQFTTLQQLQ